jgi:hypothetical protein
MTCTHCGASVFTCKGYLRQIVQDSPLAYACHPSCEKPSQAQGVLVPPEPPPPAHPETTSPWRDRFSDPPDGARLGQILVLLYGHYGVVLYWHEGIEAAGHHVTPGAWYDEMTYTRDDWTLWQPIVLPDTMPEVPHAL